MTPDIPDIPVTRAAIANALAAAAGGDGHTYLAFSDASVDLVHDCLIAEGGPPITLGGLILSGVLDVEGPAMAILTEDGTICQMWSLSVPTECEDTNGQPCEPAP